jgi:unsaturated rhamnogalacturonyl hydrolase
MDYRNIDKNSIETLIKKLVEQIIHGVDTGISSSIKEVMSRWEWESGVALFALYLYYMEKKEKQVLEFILKWFDNHMENSTVPTKNVNTVCPLLTLTYIYEETWKKEYFELCKEWLSYVMNDMPRTEENGIQHIVVNKTNKGQLWDDTLYMTVLFTCRMGILLKDDTYIQESIRQFLIHLKYLTDVKTGLLYHGWSFIEKSHFAGALWGRGNAWFSASLVDYLEMTELTDGVKLFLLSSFSRQVKALSELQSEDGLWCTLLDDPESYKETSASAGFAYGILKGVRKGYLDMKYLETGLKAVSGVLSKVDDNGVVHGVSGGTAMGSDMEHYKKIPCLPLPYGQTLTLLMLVELLKHKNI